MNVMSIDEVINGLKCISGNVVDCKTCGCHECDFGCKSRICVNVINLLQKLLKEQEVRELTIDEWREWKANPKRNPICELWENNTSPMWILNPNNVHEPALLMGKLKLFTGKPTFEQCKEVKWDA